MEATTNTTRTLKIDGMSGDACVKKVTAALRDVPGVSTQSVSVGSATFKGDESACDAACAAIDAAGYKSRKESGTSTSKDATSGGQKSQTEYKDSGQSNSSAQKSMGETAGAGASGGTASGNQGGSNQGGSNQGGSKGTDRPGATTPTKPALTSH